MSYAKWGMFYGKEILFRLERCGGNFLVSLIFGWRAGTNVSKTEKAVCGENHTQLFYLDKTGSTC